MRRLVRLMAFAAALFVAFLSITVHLPALAQEAGEVPVVTRTTAIRNARIVQAPGKVIDRGTVVMSKGIITEVGAGAHIPYDAEIIEGDSLVVYAGFIDGLSHAGMPKPEPATQEGKTNAADPPADVAGIQPQRKAREMLVPDESSVEQLRQAGFAAAHVVPRGRMLPGTGSVILLAGERADEMVLKPDVSVFMQFEGGPRVYPSTPMGVMAQIRQLVREAERRRRIETLYAENPAGLERPTYDSIHEALYPLLLGQRPLFVLADGNDSALEVHRALRLRDELRLPIALAGLHQGFDVADDLRERPVPLFLTLDLPEGKADSSKVDTADTLSPEVDRERAARETRKAKERTRYVSTAAVLHRAGLRFGVSTLGVRAADIRNNVLEMVAAGLPEGAALAALTIDGATLLGLERSLGTVERGKIANLVVSRGSYFEKGNPISYVFVDGRKFDYVREVSPAVSSIAGRWELATSLREGDIVSLLTIRAEAGAVGGDIEFPEGSSAVTVDDATLVGDKLEFTFETARYGRIRAELTVSGESLTGSLDVPGEGAVDVTGSRVPERRR